MSENKELSAGEVLTRPAEEFVNDPDIEIAWMSSAVRQMEAYYKLITSVKSLDEIKLTPNDDLLYETFQARFSDLNIESLTEESIKSSEGKCLCFWTVFFIPFYQPFLAKEKWRTFCMDMKDNVEDFNYATMLRLNCKQDYNEANTILVPRVQFIAIEIARNRRGLNTGLPPFQE